MELKVSGRHLEVTPAIRSYAENKAQRLPRYYDRLQGVNIVIDNHDRQFEVEMIMDVEHREELVARERGENLYALIDRVADKAERQLTDLKEKRRNRKHPDH